MGKMARQISRIGSARIDLSTLVATAFIDCEVLDFKIKATCLHDLVERKPKALSVDEVIQTFKNKYRYLKAQGLWCPSQGNKLCTEGEMASINMDMNNLV